MHSREEMQQEIHSNGPIMTTLTMYEDLFNYKSGIYSHSKGDAVSGHAMRIVGWGHDKTGWLYWICQN